MIAPRSFTILGNKLCKTAIEGSQALWYIPLVAKAAVGSSKNVAGEF